MATSLLQIKKNEEPQGIVLIYVLRKIKIICMSTYRLALAWDFLVGNLPSVQ